MQRIHFIVTCKNVFNDNKEDSSSSECTFSSFCVTWLAAVVLFQLISVLYVKTVIPCTHLKKLWWSLGFEKVSSRSNMAGLSTSLQRHLSGAACAKLIYCSCLEFAQQYFGPDQPWGWGVGLRWVLLTRLLTQTRNLYAGTTMPNTGGKYESRHSTKHLTGLRESPLRLYEFSVW